MNTQQIQLVQDSWKMVRPIANTAGQIFYGRLFQTHPQLQSLFRGDLPTQIKKLMTMLTVVVNGLTRLEQIIPAAQSLAVRHIDYGVKEEHYAAVGSALLWTLEQGLGEAWNEELKEAWTTAFQTLSSVMIAAHQEAVSVATT